MIIFETDDYMDVRNNICNQFMECDVKNDVNRVITSECCSIFVC